MTWDRDCLNFKFFFFDHVDQFLPSLLEVRNGYLFASYETKMNLANSQKTCQNIGATLPMLKTAAVTDAINYYNSEIFYSDLKNFFENQI